MEEIYINTNEALEIIRQSWLAKQGHIIPNRQALIDWIKRYALGKKVAGRYLVNQERLIDFLKEAEPK